MQWKYKHEAVSVPEGPTIDDLISQVTTDSPPNMAQAAARAAIEADGYRGVHDMTQGPDAAWKARAMRGNMEVGVTVAADGSVSAD